MKRMIAAVAMAGAMGCNNPVAPARIEAQVTAPKHHNIPATFAGHPEGPIIYLCATQPRRYEGGMEEDHYLQYQECPTIPIQ